MSSGSAFAVPEKESLLRHGEKAAGIPAGAGGFRLRPDLQCPAASWLGVPRPVTFVTLGALFKGDEVLSLLAKPREFTILRA